ncbi:hypothetical protein LguiB_034621 [Lonicera macranthoides]
MSSDTAKENASVVDSSVTEWKHYMGDFDNQGLLKREVEEPPSYLSCSYSYPLDNPPSRRGVVKKYTFLSESPSYKGNEVASRSGAEEHGFIERHVLVLQNSGKVILIFSINMSGFFQGYAQMISSVGWRRDSVWSQGSGGSNPWGRSFKVKWLRLSDLPFQKTLHLRNPLNDYKPVKISRDCQELPQDIGEALCELLDEESDVNDNQTRGPMFYPSLLYQHHAEVSKFHSVCQRPTEILLPENLPVTSCASEDTRLKHSCNQRNLPNILVDHDNSKFDNWHLPMERSPVTSALTEEDILDMTYEEYLEAYSRSIGSSHLPVAGPSWKIQDSSVANGHGDDCGLLDNTFILFVRPGNRLLDGSLDRYNHHILNSGILL